MSEINKDTFPKYKPNPLFKDLPQGLKDPQNYIKIEKAVMDTMICPTSHADLMEMTQCSTCTSNMRERRHLLKNLGFKSPRQYYAWKKVMMVMMDPSLKVKLPKYNE